VINLGNPTETSILELAEQIRTLVGSTSAIEFVSYEEYYGRSFEDTRRRVPDISRSRDLLSWQPTVTLDDGLGRTLEWWKQTH
jgi:UDP-glucose 4-epimerase